ncbi:MAG: hypothetical protein AAF763_13425 [Pseudomonadota bacterium]
MTATTVLRRALAALTLAGALAACAQAPQAVSPTPEYRISYLGYECPALDIELRRVGGILQDVAGRQSVAAGRDVGSLAVGWAVPPALLLTTGSDYGGEVARLKGQYEALREAAALNDCFQALAATAELELDGSDSVFAAMNLPGDVLPYEGVALSSYSPEELQAWCDVRWDRSVDYRTGRTIYNPCREPQYLTR